MNNDQQSREDFEKWAWKIMGYNIANDDNFPTTYKYPTTQIAWIGWQSAKQSEPALSEARAIKIMWSAINAETKARKSGTTAKRWQLIAAYRALMAHTPNNTQAELDRLSMEAGMGRQAEEDANKEIEQMREVIRRLYKALDHINNSGRFDVKFVEDVLVLAKTFLEE